MTAIAEAYNLISSNQLGQFFSLSQTHGNFNAFKIKLCLDLLFSFKIKPVLIQIFRSSAELKSFWYTFKNAIFLGNWINRCIFQKIYADERRHLSVTGSSFFMKIKPVLIQNFGGFADVRLDVPNLKKKRNIYIICKD